MISDTDIKAVKRRVYMTYFQDGFWDIFLGIFLLAWGFTVWFDLVLVPAATFIVFFWLILGLKQWITYPRIGYARPAEYRQRTLKIVIAGVVVLVALVVLLPLIDRGETSFLRTYFELLFNTVLAVVFGLIGYWWGVTRWYAYAVIVFVFGAFNQWLGLSFQMSFIIPGGIALLGGLFILVRFLRRYPAISEDSVNESR